MMRATQNHTATTESALRALSMRRRSARSAGIAIPLACSRSLGKTSGRSAGSGTMVLVMPSILQYSVK